MTPQQPERSDYPPYACSCCGITNGDMFSDYYAHLGVEPTERDVLEFETYRRVWNALKSEREKLRLEAVTHSRMYSRSARTRAKISRTKKAQFAAQRTKAATKEGER